MKQDDVLNIDTVMSLPEATSYAAVMLDVDEESSGREQVITELMMRRACEMMHEEQQFPFCSVRPASMTNALQQHTAQPCSMSQGSREKNRANVHVLDAHRTR